MALKVGILGGGASAFFSAFSAFSAFFASLLFPLVFFAGEEDDSAAPVGVSASASCCRSNSAAAFSTP
eukprot:CAMPEP_0204432088 /NCGR_PEP_ID=MMETSP0470-20130426/66545_1 /ASSEMBLY_ACC=CAM_ASM_000385 /TAXON_ID=2969 /ORGANISM="Oxyrrhis marina" /LENGTH=67 /DNA_ID=CAMNT_0051430365 /DNA_START=84 /DNA_END=283 /DNA_ORIENTATION=+